MIVAAVVEVPIFNTCQ